MPGIARDRIGSCSRARAMAESVPSMFFTGAVITTGRNCVTPLRHMACVARTRSSTATSGRLKSTPANPLTCMSRKPSVTRHSGAPTTGPVRAAAGRIVSMRPAAITISMGLAPRSQRPWITTDILMHDLLQLRPMRRHGARARTTSRRPLLSRLAATLGPQIAYRRPTRRAGKRREPNSKRYQMQRSRGGMSSQNRNVLCFPK
jgi:hypothetical protein